MSKPVMMIIPTQNGYALLPFDMNCLVEMNKAKDTVLVATDLEGLKDNIEAVYALGEPHASANGTVKSEPGGSRHSNGETNG